MSYVEDYQVNDQLDQGHIYTFNSRGGDLAETQYLRFMKKSGGELVYDGITNEQVLAALIHRLEYLNGQFPCRENMEAIRHLGMALHHLEARTKRRLSQGIEGQDKEIMQ